MYVLYIIIASDTRLNIQSKHSRVTPANGRNFPQQAIVTNGRNFSLHPRYYRKSQIERQTLRHYH